MQARLFCLSAQQPQQIADRAVVFYRVPQRLILMHLILVAAAFPAACQDAAFFQIGYDAKHRPFRDADPIRHIAQAGFGVLRQTNQDMRVV